MASPSPQLSPRVGASQRIERHHSASPPSQPVSKRDKRRNAVLDRITELTGQFNDNKDNYYRQQLYAIQIDTSLILHADPCKYEPLADTGDAIQDLIERANGGVPSHPILTEVNQIAGKVYSEFANEVNDAMERRDSALTVHENNYQKKITDLHLRDTFMQKLAEEEHKALASTLRDRLVNNLNSRKTRLNKEKDDGMNIGESNALHLHPNQYVITNPSSPGGIHGKRATRHRRDIEEIPTFPDSYKRKRKAADDIGSPVPTRRLLANGFDTPIWTTEQIYRAANKGNDKPLYSLEKLFTEKELHMTYSQAAVAAQVYIVTHKGRKGGDRSSSDGVDTSSNDEDGSHSADAEQDRPAEDDRLSAAPMERQYSHATRSTRGTGNILTNIGIEIVSDIHTPGSISRLAALIPKVAQNVYRPDKNNTGAHQSVGAYQEDRDADMQRIENAKAMNVTAGVGASLGLDREMLEAAISEPGRYDTWLRQEGLPKTDPPEAVTSDKPKRPKNKDANGKKGDKDEAMGGVEMSKQNSTS